MNLNKCHSLIFQSQVQTSRQVFWRQRSEKESAPTWSATLVVYLCRLAAGDCKQFHIGVFYNALWVEVWKTTLHKLVGIHDSFLLSESSLHSATEGEKYISPTVTFYLCFKELHFYWFLRIKTICLALQVVGLAVFFALVIKKAEEEDFQDVTFEKVERRPGDVIIHPTCIFCFPQVVGN